MLLIMSSEDRSATPTLASYAVEYGVTIVDVPPAAQEEEEQEILRVFSPEIYLTIQLRLLLLIG